MRKKEKEIKDTDSLVQIFKEAQVCRLGMFDGELPYIVPMNFGYSDNILYFHSALSGRKIDIIKNNPNVCFELDIQGDLIDSDKACNWSMKYKSIIGSGKVVFIENEKEKINALNIIMDHYSGKGEWDFNIRMMERTLVFRVEIKEISAKQSGD
jgi:uncharacterized protein